MLKNKTTLTMIVAFAVVMIGIGALNGSALTASAWDGLRTQLANMLTSTWVMVLALISLVASVWRLAHGGGYGMLSIVLGVLAVALIGPGFVTTIATASRPVPAVHAKTIPSNVTTVDFVMVTSNK